VTGNNQLGEALPRCFVLSFGFVIESVRIYFFSEVDSKKVVFPFLPSLDLSGGLRYMLPLTGVFCGQLFRDLFSVFSFVLRPPARDRHVR
jgi:hypothetical protein